MYELVDLVGRDAADVNVIVEKLDRGGFIERSALSGAGFYTFSISEKGLLKLPEMSAAKRLLTQDNLTIESLNVLRAVKKDISILENQVKNGQLTSLKLSVLLVRLVREGYMVERGFWKRRVKITESGETILKKHR